MATTPRQATRRGHPKNVKIEISYVPSTSQIRVKPDPANVVHGQKIKWHGPPGRDHFGHFYDGRTPIGSGSWYGSGGESPEFTVLAKVEAGQEPVRYPYAIGIPGERGTLHIVDPIIIVGEGEVGAVRVK